jgi:hypothetical protein
MTEEVKEIGLENGHPLPGSGLQGKPRTAASERFVVGRPVPGLVGGGVRVRSCRPATTLDSQDYSLQTIRTTEPFYVTIAVRLALLVGISRIYLGVHWPSDVLAGWTLGAASALGVWLGARSLARHGQIEPGR